MNVRGLLRRYDIELLWLAFALANYAAMILWPSWETIPFHFVWISLTLVYGFRVWPTRATLIVLLSVVAMTAASISLDAFDGEQLWGELFEVPLMAAMFLAMVWHARRRVEAQRIAEGRAEERRSMLERQERFIHDASHELRTPVTIARGHLELLRPRDKDVAELEIALDELSRIDAIIERLLLLATADQPDFVSRTELELEPFLEDVFMRWSEVAPRAWRLGSLACGRLLVDPERLRAALDALLENAVKYTVERDAIELRAHSEGRGEVVIEVQDEGCGVPPGALERIFDRFARADAARTRAAGGVGLGLAIVDAIAKGHGGRCSVASTHRGSVFALHLPGSCRPAARRRPPATAASPGSSPASVDPDQHVDADLAGVLGVADEHGRRRHHTGPDPRLEIASDACDDGVAAPVAIEALEIELEGSRSIPEVRVLEPSLVGEQEVVHLPETTLKRCGLGRAGRRPGARMARANREVAEHPAQRVLREPQAERRAVRALEVRVLDHQRAVVGPADVVLA